MRMQTSRDKRRKHDRASISSRLRLSSASNEYVATHGHHAREQESRPDPQPFSSAGTVFLKLRTEQPEDEEPEEDDGLPHIDVSV